MMEQRKVTGSSLNYKSRLFLTTEISEESVHRRPHCGYLQFTQENAGESKVQIQTWLARVVSEPDPMYTKRDQVSRKLSVKLWVMVFMVNMATTVIEHKA